MKISSVQFIENHLLDSTNPEYSKLCNEVLRDLDKLETLKHMVNALVLEIKERGQSMVGGYSVEDILKETNE